MTLPSADFLATVVAAARRRVDVRSVQKTLHDLEREAGAATPQGAAFVEALTVTGRVNVIAECKRRSPSKGILRSNYDPVALARQYRDAGAAAVSILTEPTFFDGDLAHLKAVRAAVDLPLLCKDFIVSDYQIVEACASGADAVLLIADALADGELAALHQRANLLGLAVLVEAHTETDIRRAVDAGARLVGVNSRNLRTLEVNRDAPLDLLRLIPAGVIAVAESGIKSAVDVERLRLAGYNAFLVGESLVVQDDPGAALRSLLGQASTVPVGDDRRHRGAKAPRYPRGVRPREAS